MKRFASFLLFAVSASLLVSPLVAQPPDRPDHDGLKFGARLSGYKEVPTLSTSGQGWFRAYVSADRDGAFLEYELAYEGLEGEVFAAHLHLGRPATSGGVIFQICPSPDQSCPQEGVVTGVVTAADVVGPLNQGIEPEHFREMVRAMLSGATYVNVHTDLYRGGEIRGNVRHIRDRNRGRGRGTGPNPPPGPPSDRPGNGPPSDTPGNGPPPK